MNEEDGRAAVVAEARSWLATPYHHNAMLKGVGVDCAMLVVAVFREAGVVAVDDVKPYPAQWFLHRDEERYLAEIEKYAHQVDVPQPGDLAVFKIGRTFAHGAIVVDPGWPTIIHALSDAGMVIEDRGDGGRLAGRERKFYSHW